MKIIASCIDNIPWEMQERKRVNCEKTIEIIQVIGLNNSGSRSNFRLVLKVNQFMREETSRKSVSFLA